MRTYSSIDTGYVPIEVGLRAYERANESGLPFAMSIEREDGTVFTIRTKVASVVDEDTVKYVERLSRAMLYVVGGCRLAYAGSEAVYRKMKEIFSADGTRAFDADFMQKVFGSFEVVYRDMADISDTVTKGSVCRQQDSGARIGFDAGGSDRKVSAVLDGEVVYDEEVVWFPKLNSDPQYHFDGILSALQNAAAKLPRVDSIGVSTAGIVVNNQLKISSLFIKVDEKDRRERVENIYIDAAAKIADCPITVANDGDVTALSGAVSKGEGGVLGIAMGTSQAAGYVNTDNGLNGWFNELAFVPVDYNEDSMRDEWCGDYGCGVKYFSQDGVIKLADIVGIPTEGSPAERLKMVQALVNAGDKTAEQIFVTIGEYLAHSIPFYFRFYDIRHLLLLGRVMSGRGGDILLSSAQKVLSEQYPDIAVDIFTPDEKMRRLGQSVTAAKL